MNTIEDQRRELLSRLGGVNQTSEFQWEARCPAHDDHKASLCIGMMGSGNIGVCCQAGCANQDVMGKIGLPMSHLFKPRPEQEHRGPKGEIVATYDYHDEDGTLLFQVVRFEPKDFRQRKPDGNGGWDWKVKGLKVVPYRLPAVVAADPTETIFVVEGEKDADRLAELGLVATCNAGGAAKRSEKNPRPSCKWRKQHASYLVGRHVAIVPDNDQAGRDHADGIARTLDGKAASVKIVELPGVDAKGDASDWLDSGGTAEDLRRLAAEAPQWQARDMRPAADGGADAPNEVEHEGPTISNFETVFVETDDGDTVARNEPLSMSDIIDQVNAVTGGWPRCAGNVLFIDDPTHGVDWFDRRTTAGLFGWLRRIATVTWMKGGHFVSQNELFAELERTATRYDAIELLPHEPPMSGVYYRGTTPEPGDGNALRWLLDRFRPETTIDRDLILAAMMTAIWGGPAGSRPMFVITSDDGRGVGKSVLAEMIGRLCGGFIDVSAGEDIITLKTRLLSSGARTKRVALLDNLKTLKFSWAELESLVTNELISGRQLYAGEGNRPNLLTWFVTLNGVSLATDMAQRSIIIKIIRGQNDGPWREETAQFINENRDAIIGDIISQLRADPFPIANYTRWATWEKDVLSRLPDPGEAQRVISERQTIANCELDEAGIIEEFFAEKLHGLQYDPATCQVRVKVATAARWFGWATGESLKTEAASRRLRQMATEGSLKRIAPDPSRTYGRGFIFTGSQADHLNGRIENDLDARLAIVDRSQAA